MIQGCLLNQVPFRSPVLLQILFVFGEKNVQFQVFYARKRFKNIMKSPQSPWSHFWCIIHATGLYLNSWKYQKKRGFFDVSWGYRKRSMVWNRHEKVLNFLFSVERLCESLGTYAVMDRSYFLYFCNFRAERIWKLNGTVFKSLNIMHRNFLSNSVF